MTDDITFCLDKCDNKKCIRHPSNMLHPEWLHSFSYMKDTTDCLDYCRKHGYMVEAQHLTVAKKK